MNNKLFLPALFSFFCVSIIDLQAKEVKTNKRKAAPLDASALAAQDRAYRYSRLQQEKQFFIATLLQRDQEIELLKTKSMHLTAKNIDLKYDLIKVTDLFLGTHKDLGNARKQIRNFEVESVHLRQEAQEANQRFAWLAGALNTSKSTKSRPKKANTKPRQPRSTALTSPASPFTRDIFGDESAWLSTPEGLFADDDSK